MHSLCLAHWNGVFLTLQLPVLHICTLWLNRSLTACSLNWTGHDDIVVIGVYIWGCLWCHCANSSICSRAKPGKSGNLEITLPALESQGIPHDLFKIREKSVNSVSSRQHQNNIRHHPNFRAVHLFPRCNGPFSSFLGAYFARCQFDGSSLRTVSTWHQLSKSLRYQ